MRTWNDYKKEAKNSNKVLKQDIEEMEQLATIIGTIIVRRKELGYSQRDLAEMCELPHSSVARIESCVVKPNIFTLLKIMSPLGLTLKVSDKK